MLKHYPKAYRTEAICLIIITALVLITILTCSCQAVIGAGEDIAWSGRAFSDALKNSEKYSK